MLVGAVFPSRFVKGAFWQRLFSSPFGRRQESLRTRVRPSPSGILVQFVNLFVSLFSSKSVIQKRLKLTGAWWNIEHAENVVQLRVMKANNHDSKFWSQKSA
tara:strand:- start:1210 stop:1515 length:306 start_codon:yes stop_codon:yes gene_type:complete